MSSKRKKARRPGTKATAPPPRRRTRANLFAVIVVAALGLSGWFLKPVLFPPGPSAGSADVIDVTANMQGFDQKVIRVKAGAPVTIRLTSLDNRFHMDGGGKHQFAVDELGVNIIARPQSKASATFTPEKPGRYDFYCDVCCGGRANPTMHGTLIVEA